MVSAKQIGLYLLLVVAAASTKSSAYEIGCIYPKAMPDPIEAHDEMINFLALAREVGQVETPIGIHNGLISGMCGSVCLSYHDPKVLHPLTKLRPILVAPEHAHNAYSIALCSLQCHAVAVGLDVIQPLLQKWNIDITERWHPELAYLEDLDREPTAEELFRIAQLVQKEEYHPFLMGQVAMMEIFQYYVRNDGWNRFGDYSYDVATGEVVKCTTNCMPYSDISGYFPKNHPGRPFTEEEKYNVTGLDMYWQPLLEDDGHGYFVRQQHVTPHLATTAKTFLPDLRNKTLDPPKYSYYEEALQVVEELRLTASDPDRRSKISFFDIKFYVRQLIQHFLQKQFESQHSYQKHLLYSIGLSYAYDDATVLAWTEKVRHDLVRPTTVIQRWGSDPLITYGGDPTIMEPVEIEARNFEAHTRVMPHSEYPSGSSCMCTVFREFTDLYTESMYGDTITNLKWGGEDGLQINCNGEYGDDLPQGGCDTSFTLADMKVLEEECGQSRLWGGMHFTKSVPGGHELCSGIGQQTLDFMYDIMADTDFGGREYFVGDERPMCSDPAQDMTGPPPPPSDVTDLFSSSSTSGRRRSQALLAVLAILSAQLFL
jgi:hypothetical protein